MANFNINRFSFTIVTITLTVIYMYVSSNVAVKSVLQFSIIIKLFMLQSIKIEVRKLLYCKVMRTDEREGRSNVTCI